MRTSFGVGGPFDCEVSAAVKRLREPGRNIVVGEPDPVGFVLRRQISSEGVTRSVTNSELVSLAAALPRRAGIPA